MIHILRFYDQKKFIRYSRVEQRAQLGMVVRHVSQLELGMAIMEQERELLE